MKRIRLKPRDSVFECPNCGSKRVESGVAPDRFTYGTGPKSIELEALVPFRKCIDCNFEYTDGEAEDLRHGAVCKHLGVMTPAEILALRQKYGLSRAEFAERTRIGEASLGRWETGELIQNPANDSYLYLLTFPENMDLIHRRDKTPEVTKQAKNRIGSVLARFRTLDAARVLIKREEAAVFQL